jgi:hypothetical protein
MRMPIWPVTGAEVVEWRLLCEVGMFVNRVVSDYLLRAPILAIPLLLSCPAFCLQSGKTPSQRLDMYACMTI